MSDAHYLTVTDLSGLIQRTLAEHPILSNLWVLGEISSFNRHASSGHCYFTIREGESSLRGVMWRRNAQSSMLPAVGDLVLVHGYVSIYEPRGDLQLYADLFSLAGIGMDQARLEELRNRLANEGLFGRKRPLPVLPRRIGLATAPNSAALHDMVTILQRRYPLADVLIAPCLVQGERAPDSIVEALYQLYAQPVDVIILARGGGASEDLAAFNDEAVARALFASPVPTITGVGHEIDTTIVDQVADLRAPTPSAAAELVAPEIASLRGLVRQLQQRAAVQLSEDLIAARSRLHQLQQRLERSAPQQRLARDRQRIDDLERRMQRSLGNRLALIRQRHLTMQARLAALNPRAVLGRGYAVVSDANGKPIISVTAVAPRSPVTITLADGALTAIVQTSTPHE